jgi:hypothetical protein
MQNRWRDISPSIVLFLFFFSVYAFTMSGVILYGDEVEKYRVAQSIVDRHEFSFRPTAHRNEIGVNGRTYSIYELGQTVFQIPLYALARLANHFFPQDDINRLGFLMVGFLNPLLTALTCVLLFKTGRSLGFHFKTSVVLTLVFGLATIAWPYSRNYTREPLLTLLLLLSFYAVWRFSQTKQRVWLFAAGVFSGYLVFTKLIQVPAVVIFWIYILFVIYREYRQAGMSARQMTLRMAQQSLLFFLPIVLLLVVQGLYAWSRFGTFYSGIGGTKYNPIDWILFLLPMSEPEVAVVELLLSPAKSAFLYSLPVLLFPVAWFKFFQQKRDVALMILALVLAAFGTALSRPDWEGGTWWGPRYLVQITPFLIIPLGILETLNGRARYWGYTTLILLSLGGFFISAVGAFSSERDYLDVMGSGTTLAGQLDFLRYGVFDSLVLYWTLENGLEINPYGLVLGAVMLLTTLWIADALSRRLTVSSSSLRWGVGWAAGVLLVQMLALVVWVIVPYQQVQSKKADTLLRAGYLFAAEGRVCEAAALYLLALDRGTTSPTQAVAQVETLLPRADGLALGAENLMAEIEAPGEVTVEEDVLVTVSGTSLKISAPPQAGNVIARVQATPLAALPNTRYELSGWVRAENVYGKGYGSITVSEDDGLFGHIHSTDLFKWDETIGWNYFCQVFTTLPTTQRLFITTWLWETPGTIWIDRVQLAQITATNPPSVFIQPCKCFPRCAERTGRRSVGPYP